MNENWFKEKSLWSKIRNAYFKDANFKKYWSNLNKVKIDQSLKNLIDFYVDSISYNMSSRFWHILNIRNINQINTLGIENFASTVALNYFTFTEFSDDRIINLVNFFNEKNVDVTRFDIFKKHKNLNYTQSINHNIIVNLLYTYYKNNFDIKDLQKFFKNNYLIENKPFIKINEIKVTQDRLNSLIEYNQIKSLIKSFTSSIKLLEIGAGAGRTTEAILLMEQKNIDKYFVVDLPPALYVNYLRVKNNFPNLKSYLAKKEQSMNIKDIIDKHDIIFLLPHQLIEMSKIGYKINLFLAIDCLHEMDKKSIKYYMKYANEITQFFYFKIWNETYVPYSFKNYLSATEEKSYFINPNWKRVSKKKSIFPSNYYDFTFKVL